MNVVTKTYKLRRAIWEYRGKYEEKTGEWVVLPKEKVMSRVLKGLERLRIDAKQGMEIINGLKNKNELEEFLSGIREFKNNYHTCRKFLK